MIRHAARFGRRRPLLPRRVRLSVAILSMVAAITLLALEAGHGGGAAMAAPGGAQQPAGKPAGTSVAPTSESGATQQPETAGTESQGRQLFLQGCSSCHGYDAKGIPGKAPSLVGAGEEAADFYLRTGRMPLSRPGEEPVRGPSPYTHAQIRALVSYVGSLGGPPIPHPNPESGNVAEGQKLFTEHCAGCHQVVARGGMVPGAVVPDLGAANATDVAEAIAIGPYVMPVFDHLHESEVNDIARYVEYTHDTEDKGGWGLGNVGPIPEGMVSWLLAGVALLFAIRLIGERTTR